MTVMRDRKADTIYTDTSDTVNKGAADTDTAATEYTGAIDTDTPATAYAAAADMENAGELRYTILDPTGNITALVETPVDIQNQPAAADVIMQRHPEVEQVGFVSFPSDVPVSCTGSGNGSVQVRLRMAGGEFCGNASLCAAALYEARRSPDFPASEAASLNNAIRILLEVSGASKPVEVRLVRQSLRLFEGSVKMPPALKIEQLSFTCESMTAPLPLVRMEGISHLIIEPDSVFFSLKERRPEAEKAIRSWCRSLSLEGLGCMFVDIRPSIPCLTPLVYIPGGETVFWENSCASGTSAAGMYLAQKTKAPVDLSFQEPGGILRVSSHEGEKDETRLHGQVRLLP